VSSSITERNAFSPEASAKKWHACLSTAQPGCKDVLSLRQHGKPVPRISSFKREPELRSECFSMNFNCLVASPSGNATNCAELRKWKPKQCVEIKPSVFLELAPGAGPYLATHLLDLCPKIVPGSIIHDNACGAGVVGLRW
jgi:hypothetical protein